MKDIIFRIMITLVLLAMSLALTYGASTIMKHQSSAAFEFSFILFLVAGICLVMSYKVWKIK